MKIRDTFLFCIALIGVAVPRVFARSGNVQSNPMRSFSQLPLAFEPNHGQADKTVKFLARSGSYAVLLADSELILTAPRLSNAVTIALTGASPVTNLRGMCLLPGKSNYFFGSDPRAWRTNIPLYRKVRARAVYPGIDLVYYGRDRQLEYDFVLAPGADLQAIRLAVRGVTVRKESNGDLVLATSAGEFRFAKPIVYQGAGAKRTFVDGQYVVTANNEVGFAVGDYDHTRPLVIDPTLIYSTFLGGSDQDIANAIALDKSGNAYVAGSTRSADFKVLNSIYPYQGGVCGNQNCTDAFVSKINAAGTALVYSTYIGGSGDDAALAITVDKNGNAYIAGQTASANFPTTAGAAQTTFGGTGAQGYGDGFVAKLNAAGSALMYSTFLGGSNDERAEGIALDANNNAYVTGGTQSADFPTQTGAYLKNCPLHGNVCAAAFVTKLNASGTARTYSTFLGGTGPGVDEAFAIAVNSGAAYVTGVAGSTNFPTTLKAYSRRCGTDGLCNGATDAFVTKVNGTGSGLVYSTYLGGSDYDAGKGIAVDRFGNAYVGGGTHSNDFPVTPGAVDGSYAGASANCVPSSFFCGDGFVTKLNPTGSALVYSTYLGGSGDDEVLALAIDFWGDAFVTGQSSSADFPQTATVQNGYAGGASDAFVTELNLTATAYDYSTLIGGAGTDVGRGIAVGANETAYAAGSTQSPDFPSTSAALQKTCGTDSKCNGGLSDAFVSRIQITADMSVQMTVSPNPVTSGSNQTYTITATNNGPDAADSVEIYMDIGTNTLVSITATQGTCKKNSAGDAVCTVSTLPAGQSFTATIVLNITYPPGTQYVAAGRTFTRVTDPNSANNSAPVNIIVQ